MKYKVLRQCGYDERRFDLEDETGEIYSVDIYTDGGLEAPMSVLQSNITFSEYLKSFIGKTLEIPKIYPYAYFTAGNIKVID